MTSSPNQQIHTSKNLSVPLGTFFRRGEQWIWLTGATLALSLVLIAGLLFIIVLNGVGYFWPATLTMAEYRQGTEETTRTKILGVVMKHHELREGLPDGKGVRIVKQTQFKIGNRDLFGQDFAWYRDENLSNYSTPEDAVAVERMENGNFYGFLESVSEGDKVLARGPDAWKTMEEALKTTTALRKKLHHLEREDIGAVNREIKEQELEIKRIKRRIKNPEEREAAIARVKEVIARENVVFDGLKKKADQLRVEGSRFTAVFRTAGGQEKTLELINIVDAYRPNKMNLLEKGLFYVGHVWGFVFDEPRESNTEGGVFPAIFGTVMMTIIMSLVVTPFGVLAAFYLREYAKQGPLVRAVRIAINNLAGVPSIVFGVFGLGFFVYFVGGGIDSLFYPELAPTPVWGTGGILWASLTLALLTVPVVIVATEESIAAVPRGVREGSLALGASKFQTICNVVLPASVPGILTGVILAMARGAGEVAPLMITGVVKLAPELPFDGHFPFLHLDRKFMHLGFHIYDVGFQSPNVEAARPMVFTTTLLLIIIVVALNVAAIYLRDRIRKRYIQGAFA
ncbi:MAG: phosphate ABC transporter permease PstA [Verrucomicrobiae bacterium]|nr:phosphate ABC transporter permease PstA [Verrucomicrobiae bacterium]